MIVGGVGNGAAEEDWHWDLNPGVAAMPREDTWLWWSGDPSAWAESGPRGFGLLLFATGLRKQERLCWEEKG